jgi:hypothetical protein
VQQYCNKPLRPVLNKLDETKPIDDITNVLIMLHNFDDSTSYSLLLEGAIKCYEDNNKPVTKTDSTTTTDSKDVTKPDTEKKSSSILPSFLPSFLKFF